MVGLTCLPSGARAGLHCFAGGTLAGATRITGQAEAGTDAGTGFHGGVGLSMAKGQRFDVAIQAAYEMRRVERKQEGDWYEPEVGGLVHERRSHQVKIGYVALGSKLRWKPLPRWFLGVGPEIAFPVTGKDQVIVTANDWEREQSAGVQDHVSNPDLALWFETGMEVRVGNIFYGPLIAVGLGVREIGGDAGSVGGVRTGLADAEYRMLRFSLVVGRR